LVAASGLQFRCCLEAGQSPAVNTRTCFCKAAAPREEEEVTLLRSNANPTREVCVCLRLDDYSTNTPMSVVRELAAILERHKVTCLFGVIPFRQKVSSTGERSLEPLSGPMADLLRELVERRLVVPALHGFAHLRDANGIEEFGSGNVAEQRAKIAQGKALLEGILGGPVSGFVPPWNVVNDASETALRELGFSYVSTALELEHTSRWDLIDVPGTCYWSARSGVLSALEHLDAAPVVVLTGHFSDFHEPTGELRPTTLDTFDRTVAWLSSLENVRVVGLDQASVICARDRATWKSVTRCRGAFDMPYRMRRAIKWPSWLPTTRVSASMRRIQALGLAFWVGIVSFFFLVGWATRLIEPAPFAGSLTVALLLLAAFIVAFAVRHHFARQITRAALLAAAGCILGVVYGGMPYR
jgi:peptidoglycan/xylan/chitin deacetylase (PgdA/CDA1 family)